MTDPDMVTRQGNSGPQQTGDDGSENVERGYAEEASGVPASEMEREVSRPPEERWSADTDEDDTGS